MGTYKNYKLFSVIALLFLSVVISCKKNSSPIPYVPVSIQINLSNPDYFTLKSPGGWLYVTGGSKGLIIYRYDQNTFRAYDRHCPYHPDDACSKLSVENSGLTVKDTCCSSVFSILDGSILGGPADRNMVEYKSSFDGNILSINN